jgi:hypothetical protein
VEACGYHSQLYIGQWGKIIVHAISAEAFKQLSYKQMFLKWWELQYGLQKYAWQRIALYYSAFKESNAVVQHFKSVQPII